MVAAFAAPAIIRTPGLLMPVRAVRTITLVQYYEAMAFKIMEPHMEALFAHFNNAMIYGASVLEFREDRMASTGFSIRTWIPQSSWREQI